MSKLKVLCFGISIDGYGAGPNQSLDNPMGMGGMSLHEWVLPTKTFQTMHSEMLGGGETAGTTGVDNDFAAAGFTNIGAWILGRNMFGPVRGAWLNEEWKGWWGANPPYHTPVYVLTHHPRKPLEMEGGTVFYFVTDGIRSALRQAMAAANGKDVRVGGGVSTIQQYLREKLIDELHLAISPSLMGSGENLFSSLDLVSLGYKCIKRVNSDNAKHVILKKV
jgi:dihydrofolate reductase